MIKCTWKLPWRHAGLFGGIFGVWGGGLDDSQKCWKHHIFFFCEGLLIDLFAYQQVHLLWGGTRFLVPEKDKHIADVAAQCVRSTYPSLLFNIHVHISPFSWPFLMVWHVFFGSIWVAVVLLFFSWQWWVPVDFPRLMVTSQTWEVPWDGGEVRSGWWKYSKPWLSCGIMIKHRVFFLNMFFSPIFI